MVVIINSGFWSERRGVHTHLEADQGWSAHRLYVFVAIGGYSDHTSLGVKCSKEVATATHGTIILVKLSILPVRLLITGKTRKPHTVLCKMTSH